MNQKKGQCGTRAEANSARRCHEAAALMSQWSLFSQQPKIQWKQELSSHHLDLNANEVDVPVSSVSLLRNYLTTSGNPMLLQDVGLICLRRC